jgi:hypothetical protein
MTVSLGNAFGLAVCKHFGLSGKNVARDIKVNSKGDEVFSVTLDIFLTAEDLAGIAVHMGAEKRATHVYNSTNVFDCRCDKEAIKSEIVDALQRAGKI